MTLRPMRHNPTVSDIDRREDWVLVAVTDGGVRLYRSPNEGRWRAERAGEPFDLRGLKIAWEVDRLQPQLVRA